MPPDNVQADQPSGSPDHVAETIIGRVIGEFEIRREIGRGGMGTVYEAWQQSLQRIVAVKVLSAPIGLSRTAVERFRREAQAAAKLHHANIVRIYAQGEAEGIYYYAMELVEGRSIHEIIQEARRRRGPAQLSATETRVGDVGPDLADTDWLGQGPVPLTDDRGLSGSRVSPGSPGGAALSATALQDFDTIARLTATVAEALDYAHQAGVIHRDIKPHNLILGNDGRLCISDFGLARVREQPGVTMTGEFLGSPLYMSPEQVCGSGVLVDHRTDIYSLGVTLYEWLTLRPPFPGQRREQVVSQILSAEPVPPRTLDPSIPLDLDTICLKAVERDAHRRYQTAGQMANDLRCYLERSGIRARRAGPVRRLGRLLYRRRVAALAAALVAVVVAFGAILYWQGSGGQQAGPGRGGGGGGGTDVLAGGAPPHSPVEATSPPLVTTLGLPRASGSGGQPLGPGPAAPFPWVDAWASAGQLGQRLKEGLLGAEGASDDDLSAQLDAFERYVAGELAAYLAAQHFLAVTPFYQQPPEPGSPEDYYFQAVLADDDGAALSLLETALTMDQDYYNARHLRAVLMFRRHRFAEMLDDGRRLAGIAPERGQTHLILGVSLLMVGRPEEARAELLLAKNVVGEDAWLHTLRGLCYARDNLGLALGAYNQALEMDPNHAMARFARGKAQAYLGGYEAALMDAEKVVELLPDSAEAYTFRGECYDRLGQYERALDDYTKALSLGGDRLSLYAKQTLAALNAREAERRAAGAPPAGEAPAEDSTAPNPPADTPQDLSPLDRFLQELGRNQRPPPGAHRGVEVPGAS